MAQLTLEERVAALEHQVEELTKRLRPGEKLPPTKDWRSTVGMFANDPIMKEIIEEGSKIRERDRELTRDDNS
jgi:hypothetical protein